MEEIVKIKEPMVNPLLAKESKADFRYQPLCKPLIEVICLPNFRSEKEVALFDRVLEYYQS